MRRRSTTSKNLESQRRRLTISEFSTSAVTASPLPNGTRPSDGGQAMPEDAHEDAIHELSAAVRRHKEGTASQERRARRASIASNNSEEVCTRLSLLMRFAPQDCLLCQVLDVSMLR